MLRKIERLAVAPERVLLRDVCVGMVRRRRSWLREADSDRRCHGGGQVEGDPEQGATCGSGIGYAVQGPRKPYLGMAALVSE